MTSNDSSPKPETSEPGVADPDPEQSPAVHRRADRASRAQHDIDDFLRFLDQVEEIGGKIRKPRTISLGNRFVL